MSPVASDAVREKAIRYITEGRIRPEIDGPISSFLCHSDDGESRYRTVVGPSWSMCTCPATVECCHRVGGHLLVDLRRSDHRRYQIVTIRILHRDMREREPIREDELVACPVTTEQERAAAFLGECLDRDPRPH